MELRKLTLTIFFLIFASASVTADSKADELFSLLLQHTTSPTEEVENTAVQATKACDTVVQIIVTKVEAFAAKNKKVKQLLDFWQCLGDDELSQDVYSLCDILGKLIRAIIGQFKPHIDSDIDLEALGNHFMEDQMLTACDLCDQAAAQIRSVSDSDVSLLIDFVEPRIDDPSVAAAFRQHGPNLVKQILEDLSLDDVCSELNFHCNKISEKRISGIASIIAPIIKKVATAILHEILTNSTQCLECNLCTNAIIYGETGILPNPKLPVCVMKLIDSIVCGKFNVTIPIIGNPYTICSNLINQFGGNIVYALQTLMHPNLICQTALKFCDADHSDNLLECVCHNVNFPAALEWILPCHWKH